MKLFIWCLYFLEFSKTTVFRICFDVSLVTKKDLVAIALAILKVWDDKQMGKKGKKKTFGEFEKDNNLQSYLLMYIYSRKQIHFFKVCFPHNIFKVCFLHKNLPCWSETSLVTIDLNVPCFLIHDLIALFVCIFACII